ncbi:MAG TPA: amidase [Candidatus Eremiobacteraceae bacterium]|nr:amidase [Candidatus Eremiobacteraceae bacterium]
MRNLTRREVLKAAASTGAVTAMLNPLLGSAEIEKKVSSVSQAKVVHTTTEDICFMDATALVALLRTKKISSVEVMKAHLAQIARVNSKVNAIVTLVDEDQLLAEAQAADNGLATGNWLGPLHGLPIGVKDLHATKGIRTTYGSPLHKDEIPKGDCLLVEREKKAGGIVIGKTNVPEFGLGSQTFNPVFGATRNPHDLTKTCGGSTGGGAVAAACGMVPLADGSDYGGSLRNPPNFCGVVGLRPSPGRVPNTPADLAWQPFSVSGGVARNVKDLAYFLSVLAGPDERIPISIEQPGSQFDQPLDSRSFRGVRVAMFRDMGLPWEPEVKETVRAQGKVLESLGCIVEEAEPDFRDANECFLSWRHWTMESRFGDIIATNGDQLNEYVHWHVEEGRKLTGPYLARVEIKRSALYQRVREFMDKYEFFVLPVNQVLPFDVTEHYPTEINGVKMENYVAWMKSACYISAAGNPAASVPCAYSKSGLPIGIQIVGRNHDDWGVLQMAFAFEQARNLEKRKPLAVG